MGKLLIIIGIAIGIVIYTTIIRPFAIKTCLINSEKCITLEYQQKGNTALIHDISTGHHILFTGNSILLYGEPTGKICESGGEPTYVWDIATSKPKGYLCSKSIQSIKNLYYNDIPVHTLKIKTYGTLDIYDMINTLIDRKIIKI